MDEIIVSAVDSDKEVFIERTSQSGFYVNKAHAQKLIRVLGERFDLFVEVKP